MGSKAVSSAVGSRPISEISTLACFDKIAITITAKERLCSLE